MSRPDKPVCPKCKTAYFAPYSAAFEGKWSTVRDEDKKPGVTPSLGFFLCNMCQAQYDTDKRKWEAQKVGYREYNNTKRKRGRRESVPVAVQEATSSRTKTGEDQAVEDPSEVHDLRGAGDDGAECQEQEIQDNRDKVRGLWGAGNADRHEGKGKERRVEEGN
ncbi:hypothetical protein BKA66DRAFT_444153 [Pyrenochaeta sp. MPI-SDFR-AT-0127]|nr:hypothetical protein BKA66DRAFT_444153 [Pyrenochaeta sp. MPI-SDFR-AT-0127]